MTGSNGDSSGEEAGPLTRGVMRRRKSGGTPPLPINRPIRVEVSEHHREHVKNFVDPRL